MRIRDRLRALREYNEDIRLTALRPGDVLCVPPSGDRGLCENGGPVYRLQEGDTLDEIAARNGTNVEQLLRLNPNLLPSDFVDVYKRQAQRRDGECE